MKIRNKAQSALATAGYSVRDDSAICLLADFAAQNSGLQFENYGDRKAFASEARSISADWKRFKDALNIAGHEGVTDADVIAVSPRAFSGRLEWKTTVTDWQGAAPNCKAVEIPAPGHWEYCTGQYFPTEYRKAAATVIEYAIREKRQSRPPKSRAVETIAELKALNVQNGGCWFDPGAMRFFGTRIESGIIKGKYFITSEQPPHGPRGYTVRSFDEQGNVGTVGELCGHMDKSDAREAIKELKD